MQYYNITDYESLLRAVRKEEYENDISTGMKQQANIVTTPVRKGSIEEALKTEDVYEELASLRKEVQELKKGKKPFWPRRQGQNNQDNRHNQPNKNEETEAKRPLNM